MKQILAALLFCSWVAQAQVPVIVGLSNLSTRPLPNTGRMPVQPLVDVIENGVALRFVADPTNALATNRFRVGTNTLGRWVHRWDGDASAFGVSTNSADNGPAINIANAVAVQFGVPLLLPEGYLKISTWISLISGTHLRGKGIGRTILLRSSSDSAQTNTHVHATLQTPGVFNPYLTNGGHGADVTASVSDITLEDFSISEASGSYSGFPIALMAAEDSTIQRVEVYGVTNHWAITLHGNRLKTVDNRIDNTGRIYQDGIHYLGGRDSIISRNIIRSGDDAIAISSGEATDPNIRNILVSDNSLYATHAHALRIYQENASATNTFEGIRFVNNSGIGGLNRNGMLRFHSASTNATYPLRDISVSKSALQMGSYADHGNDVANGGFGAFVEDCYGLRFDNVSFGPSIWETVRIVDCKDVTLNDVTAVGATYSGFFNNTVRVENTSRLSVNGGDYKNDYGYGSLVFALANVTSANFTGAFISNTVAGGGAFGCFSNSTATAGGLIAANGNTIHSRSYAMVNSYFDPTNFVFTGNEVVAPNLALYANGTSTPIPGHYVVEQNVGYDKGYSQSLRFITTNGVYTSKFYTDGNGYATLLGTNGFLKLAQDESNDTSKLIRIAWQSYSNNLPAMLAVHTDDGTFTHTRYGFGSGLNSSPRWISFGNSAALYDAGFETLRLDYPTTTGDLPLRVRIAGSNDVYRVKVGAAGTGPGGSGRAVYIE